MYNLNKTVAFTILLSITCISCYSQSITSNDSVIYSGKVLDEYHEPIIGAIVKVVNKENKLVTGMATDLNVNYNFIIPKDSIGQYTLLINYPSYFTEKISFKKLRQNETIALQKDPDYIDPDDCGRIHGNTYKVPLINKWEPAKRTFTSEEIEKMAR